jgi:hypothetical protein
MKHRVFIVCSFLFTVLFFNSCATSGIHEKSSASWSINQKHKTKRTLKMGNIITDKPGASHSIEAEIAQILPLIFLEQGYIFIADDENADFIVEVCATERDYFVGWTNKKSIAVEVLLKANLTGLNNIETNQNDLHLETPLAAGRTLAQGTQGLSSSKNLIHLLRLSVNKTVKAAKKINPAMYAEGQTAYEN